MIAVRKLPNQSLQIDSDFAWRMGMEKWPHFYETQEKLLASDKLTDAQKQELRAFMAGNQKMKTDYLNSNLNCSTATDFSTGDWVCIGAKNYRVTEVKSATCVTLKPMCWHYRIWYRIKQFLSAAWCLCGKYLRRS